MMKKTEEDFTTTIEVDQTPKQVFDAINNVQGWWSENAAGTMDKLDGEFNYHYKDVHIAKIRVIEFIPNEKVVWLVVKNHFNFTNDKSEWTNTKISFEISTKGKKTEMKFTHIGLVPSYECFEICNDAWTNYIRTSLYELIVKGKGQPNPKEGGFNEKIIEEYNIQPR